MIPITVVEFGPEVEEQVLGVLRSGIVAQGPKVKELEERFAALVGTKHAVAVSNGTVALVAAVQALDLKPGDEVLTSPFTFIATLNAVGGTPVARTEAEARAAATPMPVESRISAG